MRTRNFLGIFLFVFLMLAGDRAQAQLAPHICTNTNTWCWETLTRPTAPAGGTLGYNTNSRILEYFDGSVYVGGAVAAVSSSYAVDPTGVADSTTALQQMFTDVAAKGGGTAVINVPGTYLVSVGVQISNNTTLSCVSGVTIKMSPAWTFPGATRANLNHYGLLVNKNFASAVKSDHDLTVEGCGFDTTFSDGNSAILFAQTTHVRILRNIHNGPGNFTKMIGVDDQIISYNSISGTTNACLGTFEAPIVVHYLYNYCNKAPAAGVGYGILFTGATLTLAPGIAKFGVFEGNTIIGADGAGIWVNGLAVGSGADYSKIVNNYIDTSGSTGVGIRVSGLSDGNVISKNTVVNATNVTPITDSADPGGTPTNTIISENFIPNVAGLTGGGNIAPIASTGTGTQIFNNHVSGQYNSAVWISGSDQYVAGNIADTAPVTGLYVLDQGSNSKIVNLQKGDFAGGLTKNAWPMESHPGYGNNRWYIPAHQPNITIAGAAGTANRITCHYGTVERPVIITNGVIRVTTLENGKNAQVAVYTNAQVNGGTMGLPNALIASTTSSMSTSIAAVVSAPFVPNTEKVGPFTVNGRELWWCSNTDSGIAAYFSYALTDIKSAAYQGAGTTAGLLTNLEAGLSCVGAACTGGSSAFGVWPASLAGTTWTAVTASNTFPIIGFQATPTNP